MMTPPAKSQEQVRFEEKVAEAALKIAHYTPDQLELIDLIACDLFSGGDPAGYSKQDRMSWDELKDLPPFTRGNTTFPAKLQWRVKAARIVEIMNYWMVQKLKSNAALANPFIAPPEAGKPN